MTKILAIDDNHDNLVLLEAIIANYFPEAIFDSALSGKTGIELAISRDPDVILLDIMMPDMDGFEVCRKLKNDERVCDIPVVFLTAMNDDREKRITALEVGGEAFLYKPIDEPVFIAQISAMLKIKEFNNHKRHENERLSQLVAERTRELEQSQAETLKLLNELKAENEKYRKTEGELRESEFHFRTLANSGQALIWTSGLDKKCNYFNQTWLDFTGRTIDQELGDGWVEGVHADDLQHCIKTYVTAFDRKEKFSMEYRVRHASGEYRWIQDDGTPRFNSNNEFLGFIGHCLDITVRKQTEAALKESEVKFRALFSQMSEGVALHKLIYDANQIAIDYMILDVNPAFEEQIGIPAEKAVGAMATQLYGVSPAPYLDIYASVVETGEHQFFQTYFLPLDRHFQISVFSPNPGSFATVFTDITEDKRIEEALRESESQFKHLVDDMHVGVLLQGSQAEMLLGNPAAHDLLGLTESQLLGKTSFDPDWNVIHEDGTPFPGSTHPVPQAIASCHSVRNVVMGVYRPATQNRVWLQVDAIPQFNSQGMVEQVVCTFIDISERKKAEEALRETKNYLENLINYANAPIIVWDNDFRITQFNKAFERLSGRNESEVIGSSVEILFPAETREQSLESIKKTSAGERWEVVEIEIQDLAGHVHTLLWNSAAIYSQDGKTILTTIAQGQDITNRKLAEEALKVNEARLRELNATKDKFFTIISHDLKNPFNSILGLSNLLVEQIKEKNYEGIDEFAEVIQKSSTLVFDLLVNLLEWSRLQTGGIVFSPEYLEMVALINEVVELFADSAQQKSIAIFKEMPRNMLIFADKAMISTVLRNLISNAIKFTHSKGQIVISAESKKNELLIAIHDNGVGIKTENIEKLFRIDENQSTLGTQNEKGTGLGLILCREFIEKHGGRIWIESEVRNGSTIYFTLPKN